MYEGEIRLQDLMALPIPAGVLSTNPQLLKGNMALAQIIHCDAGRLMQDGIPFNELLARGHQHRDQRKLKSLSTNQLSSVIIHFENAGQPVMITRALRCGSGKNTVWYLFPECLEGCLFDPETYRDSAGPTGILQIQYLKDKPIIKGMNGGFVKLTGYSHSDIHGKHLDTVLPGYFNDERRSKLDMALSSRQVFHDEGMVSKADRSLIHVFILAIPIMSTIGFMGTSLCFLIPKALRPETMPPVDVLSTIVKKAPLCATLGSMGKMIHQTVKRKISAPCLYIALFDREKSRWHFPYFNSGGHEPLPSDPIDLTGSLTEFIFQLGKGMIVTQAGYKRLLQVHRLKRHGKPASAWIGVPLKSNRKMLGVLAVQTYEKNTSYSDDDLSLMKHVSGIVATLVERQQITEKLARNEHQFRILSSTLPIGHWLASYPKLNLIKKNHYFDLLLGIEKDSCSQLTSGACLQWLIPEDRERLRDLLSRKPSLKRFSETFKRYDKNGRFKWLSISAFPVRRKGETTQVAGFITDVTAFESSRNEKNILYRVVEAANRRITDVRTISKIILKEFTALWDISTFSVSMIHAECGKLETQVAYRRSHDLRFEQVDHVDHTEQRLIDRVMKSKKAALIQGGAVAGSIQKEAPPITSWMGAPLKGDGSTIGVLSIGSAHDPFRFNESDLTFLRQVSKQFTIVLERQILQNAVMEREIYYRKLTEHSNDLCMILDAEGHIQYISPSCLPIFGWRPEQLTGRNVLSLLHSEDAKVAGQLLDDWRRGMNLKAKYIFRLRHKRHGLRFISLSGNNLLNDPIVGGIVINGHDVTNEHQSKEQLKEINAELDTFVYRASHDLKGPLASILGLLQLSEKEVSDPVATKYLNMIETSARKLDSVLNDLLSITRIKQGKVDLKYINLYDLVQEIFERLKHRENYSNIRLRCDIDQQLQIRSDQRYLESILQNLIENAMKYHKNPNREKKRWVSIRASANTYSVTIKVSDNGCGMKREIQSRIFEMFFRGSEVGDGTGLGLYIVKSAVRKLNGNIHVKSTVQKGSIFEITLPKSI